MPHLPTGIVTFLFTDIEGSTRLRQAEPAAYEASLAQHNAILSRAIEASGGYVFKTIGDAFCAAFDAPARALLAAEAAQRALQTADWGRAPLRVRMALHTGTAELRNHDYFGFTLARAARLLSAAHGGQTLLSLATAELVRHPLTPALRLRDLGQHRLKDLVQPEHIFQLDVASLPVAFPPLRTLDHQPHNLPAQLTSFVGREKETARVRQLLGESRLLTLTGPGGTGKTRLSLLVAAEVIEQFRHGVWLVELAPITEPSTVVAAVAGALGVREMGGPPLVELLTSYLAAKSLLLVLDNCEHVVASAAQLSETLLRAAPNLRILATSREPLGVSGEVVFGVPTMSLPSAGSAAVGAGDWQLYEAMRLFVERATAASPTFTVSVANAPVIARICRQLDGIPLAIELAAVRVRVLGLEQLAARLDDRFRLLAGGSRSALPRQQTLRALVDWSYELLSVAERVLFARLAVFAGGWTLEAAEHVGSGHGIDEAEVLDLLSRLVDKSMVIADQSPTGGVRYRMLDTIRQYGQERLAASGELPAIQRLHLAFFLGLAERAEIEVIGSDQLVWLERLDAEQDNLRLALETALPAVPPHSGWSPEAGQRLAGALGMYWFYRGFWTEARHWLHRALAADTAAVSAMDRAADTAGSPNAEPPTHLADRALGARATALLIAAIFEIFHTSIERAQRLCRASLEILRPRKDLLRLAYGLQIAGVIALASDLETAEERFAEALVLFQRIGYVRGIADTRFYQLTYLPFPATVPAERLDEHVAQEWEACARLARGAGERWTLSQVLISQARWHYLHGRFDLATTRLEEVVPLSRELRNSELLATVYFELGRIAQAQADYVHAWHMYEQSRTIRDELGNKRGLPFVYTRLGLLALAQMDTDQARRMFQAGLQVDDGVNERFGLLVGLAVANSHAGDYGAAHTQLQEAVAFASQSGSPRHMAECLTAYASLAVQQQRLEWAARLLSAAEAHYARAGLAVEPADRFLVDRPAAALRDQMVGAALAAAWSEGLALTPEAAIAYASHQA